MKLKEICENITDGSHNPPSGIDGSEYLMLSSKNVFDDKITLEEPRFLSEEQFLAEDKRTCIKAGDVLMTIVGTVGRAAVVTDDITKITLQRSVAVLHPHSDVCNSRFLMYLLQSKKKFFEQEAHGVAQKGIYLKQLSEISVSIPAISQQEDIVDKLDRVNKIIKSRQLELDKLDELIKARFVEMFGDVKTNSKGLKTAKGSELFNFSSGKFLTGEKRLTKGIPVYGGNGIAWYTEDPLVNYPTIIIGRVGAQCGNIHLVNEPVWITDNAIYIKEHKTDSFTLEFLSEMMTVMDFYQYADFSGQPKITQKPLENTKYLIPTIKEQRKYSEFCNQVDKSKFDNV